VEGWGAGDLEEGVEIFEGGGVPILELDEKPLFDEPELPRALLQLLVRRLERLNKF